VLDHRRHFGRRCWRQHRQAAWLNRAQVHVTPEAGRRRRGPPLAYLGQAGAKPVRSCQRPIRPGTCFGTSDRTFHFAAQGEEQARPPHAQSSLNRATHRSLGGRAAAPDAKPAAHTPLPRAQSPWHPHLRSLLRLRVRCFLCLCSLLLCRRSRDRDLPNRAPATG